MKSKECPWYVAGLCPDSERIPDTNAGNHARLFVVLPYFTDPRYEEAVRLLCAMSGTDPRSVIVSRELGCVVGEAVEAAAVEHCAKTRLANSIGHSGAGAVFAIGRGPSEHRYPVPAAFAPDPRDCPPREALPAWVRAWGRALELSASVPSVIWHPAPEVMVEEMEGANAIVMHAADSGRGVSWTCSLGRVYESQAELAPVLAEGKTIITLDSASLLAMDPTLFVGDLVDLAMEYALPIRRERNRSAWGECISRSAWGEWVSALVEAAEILEPGAVDRIMDEPLDAVAELDIGADLLEIAGPPPDTVGDPHAALLTDRAARLWTLRRRK
jgi:hypothetical protein